MNYPSNVSVVKLSRPLNTTKGEVEELHLHEPTVRDKLLYEKNKGSTLEKEISMIASLSGVEPAELHELSAWDYSQLGAALNAFLLPPEARSNSSSSLTIRE